MFTSFLPITAVLITLSACTGLAIAEPITPERIRVIDGDTIRVDGTKPDIRLVGFNAPETRRAKCPKERELGDAATRRVRDLIRSGSPLELRSIACSCAPGTEGTMACNFGRKCGTLSVGGQDVGATLIAENLAEPFICSSERCQKMPKPWCE